MKGTSIETTSLPPRYHTERDGTRLERDFSGRYQDMERMSPMALMIPHLIAARL